MPKKEHYVIILHNITENIYIFSSFLILDITINNINTYQIAKAASQFIHFPRWEITLLDAHAYTYTSIHTHPHTHTSTHTSTHTPHITHTCTHHTHTHMHTHTRRHAHNLPAWTYKDPNFSDIQKTWKFLTPFSIFCSMSLLLPPSYTHMHTHREKTHKHIQTLAHNTLTISLTLNNFRTPEGNVIHDLT